MVTMMTIGKSLVSRAYFETGGEVDDEMFNFIITETLAGTKKSEKNARSELHDLIQKQFNL